MSPDCTRTLDVSKYRLDLEVDGGSGGCQGRSEISTRPGSGWRWLGSGGCKGVDASKI